MLVYEMNVRDGQPSEKRRSPTKNRPDIPPRNDDDVGDVRTKMNSHHFPFCDADKDADAGARPTRLTKCLLTKCPQPSPARRTNGSAFSVSGATCHKKPSSSQQWNANFYNCVRVCVCVKANIVVATNTRLRSRLPPLTV